MNLRDLVPGAARLSERFTGFSARRSLPRWRNDVFDDAAASLPDLTRHDGGEGGEVVLFADTFNRYFERENLDAALKVLAAGGYRVHVAKPADDTTRPLCCGRTFLSIGAVDEAKHEAERTLTALAPFISRGVPVVGLEPSCLLGFRDEIPAMLKSESANRLADLALTFEEFLAREAAAGRLNLPLKKVAGRALLHGHCHQKAFDAFGAVETVLKLIPDLKVEPIEFELLRHGRQLRLCNRHHRRVAGDGRAVAPPGGAPGRCRYAHRRRRHLLPPPDPATAPAARRCMSRACWRWACT